MRTWTDFLVSWLPMLFFIGVWWYFMRNPFWKQTDYYERRHRHMEKIEELLGRIATALEKR
jgi:ATP-dependent Zn protease